MSATDIGEALEQFDIMAHTQAQKFLLNYLRANIDDIIDLLNEEY